MINVSEGSKQETINLSMAEQERQVNVPPGEQQEITLVARQQHGLEAARQQLKKQGGQRGRFS